MSVTSTYLHVRPGPGATVARILREKVSEFEADIIRNEALAAIEAGSTRLALDLSEVQLLTSAGLGALITIDRECRARNGRLVLFGVSDQLLGLLRLTRLDRVFAIKPDEAAALSAAR